METIEILSLAVDANDFYTQGHSDRVSYYSIEIGKAFDLDEKSLNTLRLAGIFHDIGKIGINNDILYKCDRLSRNEYIEIKSHPIKGASILSKVSMLDEIVPLVKYHHERMDGKGYPFGLKGEDIPFMARIIAVADSFDAMTSDRKYRMKLKLSEAKKQLIINSGTQFDSVVVERFLSVLKNYDKMQKDVEYTYLEKNYFNYDWKNYI
ncbi:UNVERIFIED_CONTAM: putative nucleotidyltransferase with HDIG domain [Acetivibrio alkalicellulosi]